MQTGNELITLYVCDDISVQEGLSRESSGTALWPSLSALSKRWAFVFSSVQTPSATASHLFNSVQTKTNTLPCWGTFFCHTSHVRKLSVDKGKRTDCLGRGGRVLFSTQTHTNIVTLAQAGTQTHIPSEPSKEAAWIKVLIKIKTKQTRLLLIAMRDIKSEGHPYHHTHTSARTRTKSKKDDTIAAFLPVRQLQKQRWKLLAARCSWIKPWMGGVGGSVTNSPPSVIPLGGGWGGLPCTLWYPCLHSFSRRTLWGLE